MCHKDYAAITEKSVQDIGDIAIMRPLASFILTLPKHHKISEW